MTLCRSTSARFATVLVGLVAGIAALCGFADGAVAGAATGNEWHTEAVFVPMATTPRFIRVSDGAECTPVPDIFGGYDFQMEDSLGNDCVPVFVREGAGLAELNAVVQISTCTVDTNGGSERSMDLFADTTFPASSNPVLTTDVVLPTQTFSDSGYDPDDQDCQGGDQFGPGPRIDGSGWFPIYDSGCINASELRFGGMVIPVEGSNPGNPLFDQLADAGAAAFSEIQGFDPIPMVIDVTLNAGEVIGTDQQDGPVIGPGVLPSCAGVATSTEYSVVVRFALPAGFVPPPPPSVPALAPSGIGLLGALVIVLGCGTMRRRFQ